MPYYDSTKHDIGLLRQDGTTSVGLMLRKVKDADRNEVPVYRTVYDNYLVNQYTTSPDYGATNPIQELHIVGDDWRSGFGQRVYDSNDPKRYYSSIGCDLSNKGMAMAGWNSTAVTLPTYVATNEANMDWETWSDATTPGTWTEVTPLTRAAGQGASTYAGSQTANLADWTLVASQSVTWDASYQSKVFYLQGWGKLTGAGAGGDYGVKFALYDGVARDYTGVCGNDSAIFEQSTRLQFTANVAATELTIEVWCKGDGSGANVNAFDTMELIEPTAGAVAAKCEHSGTFYFSYGNTVCYIHATTGVVTYYCTYPATVTDLCSFTVTGGLSYLFVALGVSEICYYNTTLSTLASGYFVYFASVDTTVATLWGAGASTLRSSVNPINGGTAWSGLTYVDNSANVITGLIGALGTLYIAKIDKTYYLDSSADVQVLTKMQESERKSTSGKNIWFWGGKLYIPCGDQALLESDISLSTVVNTWRNPADYATDLSDFAGRIFAGAGDSRWNYVVIDNSTKIEVLKGRQETIDGSTSWVWHPIHELTLEGCNFAFVTSSYQKRLYIASTVATGSLYYLPLPTTYGNMAADSNRTFKTNTYFTTPWYHGGFKGSEKAWVRMTVTLGHTYDAAVYWAGYYQKLGDSDWTSIGNFVGTATDRTHTLYIPVDGSGYNPTSSMMKFKFIAVTDSTDDTPVMNSLDVKTILRPEARNIIECAVRCADGIRDKKGDVLQGVDAAYIRTVIEEAQDAPFPITLYDINGTTKYVNIMPMEPFSEIIKSQSSENEEEIFYLRLQEVTISGSGTVNPTSAAGYTVVRSATKIVAASDSSAASKAQADYVCDGTADQVQIQAAIDAVAASPYGSVCLMEGVFYIAADIDITVSCLKMFGQGYRTVLTAASTNINIIHIASAANYIHLSDFQITGDSKTGVTGLYLENCIRSYFDHLWIYTCKEWGIDIKYNHSLFFTNILANSNGASSSTGAIRIGQAGTPANVVSFDGLIIEGNYIGVNVVRGSNFAFRNVTSESNLYESFLVASADASKPARGLIESVYCEDNNKTGGTYDISIVDGTFWEVKNIYINNTNVTYQIGFGNDSRYSTIGNIDGGVYFNGNEAFISQASSNTGVTFGTNTRRIKNCRREMANASLDLSGAATDILLYQAPYAGKIIAYNVFYTEASSGDAGVNIRIGRYQDGVALDDDYFDIVASEVSKALGYTKRYSLSDLTNSTITAGDTITCGTAGGKTGTGEVRITLEIMESN